MTCRTDSCSQGRRRCPTPHVCNKPRAPIVIDWRRARWYLLALLAVVWLVVWSF